MTFKHIKLPVKLKKKTLYIFIIKLVPVDNQ